MGMIMEMRGRGFSLLMILLIAILSSRVVESLANPRSKTSNPRPFANFVAAASIFSTTILSSTSLLPVPPVHAADAPVVAPLVGVGDTRLIGKKTYKGGFLMAEKTLKIRAFEDPEVDGLTLFLSTQESSANSLSSVVTGKRVSWKEPELHNAADSTADSGTIVYKERRPSGIAFLGKRSMQVTRYYDETSNSLVYVASGLRRYSYDGSLNRRVTSSICAVHLDP